MHAESVGRVKGFVRKLFAQFGESNRQIVLRVARAKEQQRHGHNLVRAWILRGSAQSVAHKRLR